MLTPITWRDRIALLVICSVGIGTMAWLMPWAVQHPFLTPPDQLNLLEPGRKRLSEVDMTNLTPVVVGVVVVAACVALYAAWMSFWMSRPVVLQRSPRHPGDRG
jgi:hypothetical protein